MTEAAATATTSSSADTTEAFKAGQAYMNHVSEAAVAVVLDMNGESEGWMADAATLLEATAGYGPTELRAFISGVHHAAEAEIEDLHCRRPRVVLVNGDYALGMEND